jgi:neutral ceramidase
VTQLNDVDTPWLVGCGRGDITGEPWGVGMMGYGMRFQRTTGIHLRQTSRAFVILDRASGERIVFVVAEIGMFFRNVRDAVVARLDPAVYREDNIVLTATHTHAGVAGYSCYRLYNMTTNGFRPRTYQAIVDGVVASIAEAERDLAPGRLFLSRGELRDASVNRSPQAFDRNPEADRSRFPGRIDASSTLLRLEREGRMVGAVNWFATHGTSLTNRNTLISGDNKGYAAWRWEADEPRVVAAFAQSNAGDMSPNVPDATQGPTDDEVENTRIIGERQLLAAKELSTSASSELVGGLDSRLSYVDMARVSVGGEFTPDGREHRTGRAVLGAAFAAGTKEGPGARFCQEGVEGNRLLSVCSGAAFRVRAPLSDAQRPKAMLIPVGALGWTAGVLPVQLVRLGSLILVALAQEVTIVAGLRLRRAVADAFDCSPDDVMVQGYANDYAGYVTTPEEYDAQRYEGGHTMFGRWELPAYLQEVSRVARDLRDGVPSASPGAGSRPPLPKGRRQRVYPEVRCTGVDRPPLASYSPGDQVEVAFAMTDPRGRVLGEYFRVERRDGDSWLPCADDGDWSTTIEWERRSKDWVANVTWSIPADARGEHRFCYFDGTTTTLTDSLVVGA